ncbi:hypothetical protein D3C79_723260 [compost metagenome]
MAFVAAIVFGAGVPCAFDIVDSHVGTTDAAAETNIVEQEELRLWPEQHGIRDAGRAQEVFCTLGDGTRVTVVALHGAWLENVAANNQGGFFEERIQHRSAGVWHQHHVRFVDAFPAADRGAVKHLTFFEEVGIHLMSRDGDVLFFTLGVSETQVYEFHFMLIQHRQNVFSGHT